VDQEQWGVALFIASIDIRTMRNVQVEHRDRAYHYIKYRPQSVVG
jgi:hypothetical protein